MKVNANKIGLVFATVLGGVHIVWALFVSFGWGQGIINFVFWAHMISIPLIVTPFNLKTSIVLVVVAAALGYLVGYVFATAWNKIHHAKWIK